MISINKISVDGFKNISNLCIELNQISALLSVNNYGKSNVLNAISFGFEFIECHNKQKSQMMTWRPGIPLTKLETAKNFNFKFEFSTVIDEIEYFVEYGYGFKWSLASKDLPRVVNENLKIKKMNELKYTSFIERNEDEALYKTSPTGRCDKPILIRSDELVINKIMAYDNLYYLDIINSINEINVYIDRHFDSEDLYEVMPIVEKNQNILSPFSNNSIARTLFFMQKEHPSKYKLIINTMKDLFPYILEIKISEISLSEKNIGINFEENDRYKLADFAYVLSVKDKNLSKTVPFYLMSDGVKRILSLLTYMTLADLNNIPLICIEEPENSIHPGLFQKYMQIIEGFLDNSKVIITSHSPYLVNNIDLQNLYIGQPNENGFAIFKKVRSSAVSRIQNYASNMGVQTGEYLFSVISGNDEFDIEVLRKYLENV